MVDRLEESDGRVNVHARYDELLRTEGGHLEFLDHVERVYVFGILRRIRSVREYGGRDMKANGVDDDHGEDSTEYLLFPHHEMEPRVQDYGLTSDHAIPANGDDGHGNIVIDGLLVRHQLEELEEETEGV